MGKRILGLAAVCFPHGPGGPQRVAQGVPVHPTHLRMKLLSCSVAVGELPGFDAC